MEIPMARPRKQGCDYFPVDVNFDEKVQSLEMLHGNNGLVWILKFWQAAYQNEFGEVKLDGLFGELHANKCRISIEEHQKILSSAVQIDLIYKTDDDTYSSNGIKKRICAVSKERESAIIRQEEKNQKKNNTKRRVKESKVKETPRYSANNSRITAISYMESIKYTPQYRLSYVLWESIFSMDNRIQKPDLFKWACEIEKMHRIDKRSWDFINELIRSVREDSFWKNVILSASSLRKNCKDNKLVKFFPKNKDVVSDEEYIKNVEVEFARQKEEAAQIGQL